jgi:uncharacterized repeat protein (TIGR02543 family)
MKEKTKLTIIITAIMVIIFLMTGCDPNPMKNAEWKLDRNHTPLRENVWTNGSISSGSEVWYSVTANRTCYIWWNDSKSGDGTKTADIRVGVYSIWPGSYNDGSKYHEGDVDSGWVSPYKYLLYNKELMYLRVTATNSGTFAIAYTTGDSSTRPDGTITNPTYTITYRDVGGGTFSGTHGSGYPTTHTYGTDTTLVSPTKTGYVFDGWFVNSDGTGYAGNSLSATGYTAHITLYAKWTVPYTITITYMDVGGGIFSGTHGSGYPTTHTYGTATTLGSPTKTGYIFHGWFINSDGKGFALSSLSERGYTANVILYAKWVPMPVIDMVWIQPGTFTMGSPESEPNRDSDETQHEVTLTKGFYMGKYPVTQAQYEVVMRTNPSSFRNSSEGDNPANRPVEGVSWYNSLVFCNRLSMADGRSPAYRINGSTDPSTWGTVPSSSDSTWDAVEVVVGSTGYRLPTEAQWEYVCRAETTTAYNTGATISDNTGWYSENSGNRTHEVGLKPPNAWGLYDMHGNVREWCWDRYGIYGSGAQTDPTGAVSGSYRVERGGSWGNIGRNLRSAIRYSNYPYYRYNNVGFRLSRP